MEAVEKRNRDESAVGLPEVKKLRYDIFDTLDDVEVDTEVSDLASVMKSFEEEIEVVKAVEELDHDLSASEIGWLLEASDDELGLPPSGDRKEDVALHGLEFDFACGDNGDVECLGLDDLFGYEDNVTGFGCLS